MEIKAIQVMRGPNYWSVYRKNLIVMRLNIGKYEELPTNKIPDFYERLMRMLPSLYEHRCSEGRKGGLCDRMREGTWLGHVIEHVALELQTLAGMECGFGRTRSASEYGEYNVVFSYRSENAGIYAARAAVELVEAAAEKKPFDVKAAVEHLSKIWRKEAPGPSTQAILNEAIDRNIPVTRLNEDSLYLLGYGVNQQLFCATVMGTTSNIGVEAAGCKWFTKGLLENAGISVPKGVSIYDKKELEDALEEIPFPLVIKPVDGNHGRGITADIKTKDAAIKAFQQAQKISDRVIVEQYIKGDDYRFLLINYKLTAVAKRTPPVVTGNGVSTIKQLVREINANPNRGSGHEKILTAIKIDQHTRTLLKEQDLTPDTVLPAGKEVLLKRTANLSTGGTSTDVTDSVHPFNIFLAERVARLMKLDVCGIDIVAHDITQPIREGNGAIIEVNAGPGFRMHTHPSEGTPRNIAKPVIDMLFPEGSTGRIPIVAVTGTNGKTTTTRLIAHMAQHAGKSVGYTTTEGVYINGHVVVEGDCSGPKSANMILRDPMVDYAVLECARGGILRSGLAFDSCDISIVTNVTEDHLGLNGINTMEEYAAVKEVLPRSTSENGYAILNADDDLVYEMRNSIDCNLILFSASIENTRITEHCSEGGKAITIEDGFYVFCEGELKTRVIAVNQVPVTFEGKAEFMVANVLPAIAAGFMSGFSMDAIRGSLLSFIPSDELTPGRMNLFEFEHCNLMLDYAHNAAGFQGIQKYMEQVDSPYKMCVIGATGDRRDDDIRNLGRYAATIFDEVIIRHDKDSRGRANEELTELIMSGIHSVDRNKSVRVISDEAQAIETALTIVPHNGFIFICADHVKHSIEIIKELQHKQLVSATKQAS